MFGTSILMASDDGVHHHIIAERMAGDPMEKMVPGIENGYMFRSPGISVDNWQPALESLLGVDGTFSISAVLDEEKNNSVTALITFSERNDAAVFAWTHMDVWQKWSKENEAQEQLRLQNSHKPVVEVDENGKVKVKVTVTTLGD